jgi:hypothetical protein
MEMDRMETIMVAVLGAIDRFFLEMNYPTI